MWPKHADVPGDAVKLLLEVGKRPSGEGQAAERQAAGGDINAASIEAYRGHPAGSTALDIATRSGHVAAGQLLIAAGANAADQQAHDEVAQAKAYLVEEEGRE